MSTGKHNVNFLLILNAGAMGNQDELMASLLSACREKWYLLSYPSTPTDYDN